MKNYIELEGRDKRNILVGLDSFIEKWRKTSKIWYRTTQTKKQRKNITNKYQLKEDNNDCDDHDPRLNLVDDDADDDETEVWKNLKNFMRHKMILQNEH